MTNFLYSRPRTLDSSLPSVFTAPIARDVGKHIRTVVRRKKKPGTRQHLKHARWVWKETGLGLMFVAANKSETLQTGGKWYSCHMQFGFRFRMVSVCTCCVILQTHQYRVDANVSADIYARCFLCVRFLCKCGNNSGAEGHSLFSFCSGLPGPFWGKTNDALTHQRLCAKYTDGFELFSLHFKLHHDT